MPSIILATLNARYIHCAFGLRYLWANLGELKDDASLLEFTTQQPTLEILDAILEQQPRIVGFGVYIWNIEETTRLIADLKRVRPDIVVVLGGPEVSYESEGQPIVGLADHVIGGEADLAFASFCREYLAASETCDGSLKISRPHTATAPLPALNELTLPYDLYSDEDIAHRVIYVEASRGCPFTCEFCLSALEIPVRQFPLEDFLAAIDKLLRRGARQFKFVDRTFNLNLRVSRTILEFFLERYQPGLFLHFEMIPDRLPEALKQLITRFPAGALQFEVGIQTFNPDVCKLISRQQDNEQAEQNLNWLRNETGVHIHADLIVGLPGETLESFGEGFDRLVALRPHEIRSASSSDFAVLPSSDMMKSGEWFTALIPPYEILSNKLLGYAAVQELRRFAKYWDAIANSGNFVETLPLVWMEPAETAPLESAGRPEAGTTMTGSPFHEFRQLVAWLFAEERKTHGIALGRLLELLMQYLTERRGWSADVVAASLWRDYQRGGRSDKPKCLRPYLDANLQSPSPSLVRRDGSPKRQSRHHTA